MKLIKSSHIAMSAVVLLALSPVVQAQSLSEVAEVAKAFATKSGVNVNAQVGVMTGNSRVSNNATSNGGGNAAAGLNAQAGRLGNGQNAAVGVNAQIGVMTGSSSLNNRATSNGGGNAAAGLNAQAVQ